VQARSRLYGRISELRPDAVVAVGIHASRSLIPDCTEGSLESLVGRELHIDVPLPVPLVVLPHPSGRSTWIYRDSSNRIALDSALRVLGGLIVAKSGLTD